MIIEYIKAFVYGILFGIPFCLAAGPVFFLLIQAGVNKGIKYAMAIAYGVILADILLINATYFFVDIIHGFILRNDTIIEIAISILLIVLGLLSIFKKVQREEIQLNISKKGTFLYFSKGFVLNILNPSNFIVWLGVNSKLISYNNTQHILFYVAAIFTIAVLMFLISFLSKKIKPYLKDSVIRIMNVTLGIIYILFALVLFMSDSNFHNLI